MFLLTGQELAPMIRLFVRTSTGSVSSFAALLFDGILLLLRFVRPFSATMTSTSDTASAVSVVGEWLCYLLGRCNRMLFFAVFFSMFRTICVLQQQFLCFHLVSLVFRRSRHSPFMLSRFCLFYAFSLCLAFQNNFYPYHHTAVAIALARVYCVYEVSDCLF